MNFLKDLSVMQMATLGAFVLCAIWIVIRGIGGKAKKIKFGNVEIDAGEKEKEDRKVLAEIVNFTWSLNEELSDGVHYFKRAARRDVKVALHDYEVFLKMKYLTHLKQNFPNTYEATYTAFCSELSGQFHNSQMMILLDLYEHNHISQMNDAELQQKANELYGQMAVLFQERFQGQWPKDLLDYGDLYGVCRAAKGEVIEMLYKIVVKLQAELKSLYKMQRMLQDVRNATTAWIVEKGLLPVKAMGLVGTFFEEGKGFNSARVNEFLELIKL